MDDEADDVVVPGTSRPSRSAKRIVAAVAVAVMVLAGLAWWVLAASYSVADGPESIDCEQVATAALQRDCGQAKDDRRTTALLLGAGVAIAACAVSTVPSKRLTGEKLGPLR